MRSLQVFDWIVLAAWIGLSVWIACWLAGQFWCLVRFTRQASAVMDALHERVTRP